MDFVFGPAIVIGLALLFAFSNGFRDSSTIVATVISTRALGPTKTFLFSALFEFLGALLFGSAVALTLGRELMDPSHVKSYQEMSLILSSALVSALIWGIVGWWRGWPISNNHALIGGLVGASWAIWGTIPLKSHTLSAVLAVLIASPFLGFGISIGLTKMARWLGGWMTPHVLPAVRFLHVLSCLMVSFAHGSNDGQMVMGLVLLANGLMPFWIGHESTSLHGLPFLLRLSVAFSIGLGVLVGGRRMVRKIGMKFYRIRALEGVSSQLSSIGTIFTCALTGFPSSTTQVIAGSIVGAGVAKNPRAVRWSMAREIVLSWVITLPLVALAAFGMCKLMRAMV